MLFCKCCLWKHECQFRGIGQGMMQTYLYLWYPLFQVLLEFLPKYLIKIYMFKYFIFCIFHDILYAENCFFLVYYLEIDRYDKRDDFSFTIVNFPFIQCMLQHSSSIGIWSLYLSFDAIFQNLWISLSDRGLLLTKKDSNWLSWSHLF